MVSREETSAARRRLIVEKAAECFILNGFHQTSIRDIADRAGISLGNLYNHFDSKADLIAEIASLESEEVDLVIAALENADGGKDRLQIIASVLFEQNSRPEVAVLAAEITAEAYRNEKIADHFEQNRRRLAKLVTDTMHPQDPAQAEIILDLVHAVAMRSAFLSAAGRERTKRQLLRSVEALARISG